MSTDENQENILKWAIRYVLIPVSLAVITGMFALEVIDREIDSRQQPQGNVADSIESIFATMTAVAPKTQPEPTETPLPTNTPTVPPTPATEAKVDATPVVEGEDDGGNVNKEVPADTAVSTCGQVPADWQLYTVQPGNTLYSLARWSGTTIANIQQANCLYGQLMAYSRIWLPPFFVEETAEPIVEVTPVTVTPTITVTEEVALPDLINDTRDWPVVDTSCDDECVTTVTLAVRNVGTAVSDSFDVLVRLDPQQSVVIVGVMEGLGPGGGTTLTLSSPLGDSCYDPDCTVCISVDSRGAITEANEENNLYCTTFGG
ncbi:LysM peptidoglycan-binding domain-containing protein [Candidatus Leptofilum sp.]|uniref:LysM peptidoglycan-binding domain-containing protein n=1 Tax=Candidatus Leptofilum sp. TaxID=3241576 RepID=UPI003B5C511F